MAETDITQTTTIDMSGNTGYTVIPKSTDSVNKTGDTRWTFENFTQNFGYYEEIPELKKAINSFSTWVTGRGWTASSRDTVLLDSVDGWREDTFKSIMWNMIVIKKVNGDSFAEIIRNNDGRLINLKPLSPENVTIVLNKSGRIKRYEETLTNKKIKPQDMLHFCNDRVGDNSHGTSVIDSLKWVIDAIQEAMADKRRQLHNSTIRIMEVDEDEKERLTNLKSDYSDAIKKGDVLLVPKGTGVIQDLGSAQTEHLTWINYLENKFYKIVGMPKVIAGDADGNTEASSKMIHVSFEPLYIREIEDLEDDIWNQLAIKVKFNRPPSLFDQVQEQEGKNNAQTGVQPNDVQAGAGK